jgi:predicted DNA-binding protein
MDAKVEVNMGVIVLRDDLHERLEQNAAQASRSVDDLLNEAVERYLREQRHIDIQRK